MTNQHRQLNLPGLRVVLDLRNQFGFKLRKAINYQCITMRSILMQRKENKVVRSCSVYLELLKLNLNPLMIDLSNP